MPAVDGPLHIIGLALLQNGGKPCRGVSFENRASKKCKCDGGKSKAGTKPSDKTQTPAKKKADCVWSTWSAWTQCHCDKGYAKRIRTKKTVKVRGAVVFFWSLRVHS
jgi:hypothetical protein